MKDFSQKIVEEIKEEKIKPEPRWRLNLKSYAFWLLMIFMVILGAMFFSFMILNIIDVDLQVFHFLGVLRFMRILFLTAPLLWIVLSFLALSFGVLAFRKTNRGYRYSLLFATSLIVLIISITGTLVHISKINDRFGREFGRMMPEFQKMVDSREGRWNRPHDGLLGGEIIAVQEGEFDLEDLRGGKWKIRFDGNTELEDIVRLEVGMKVGVIGEKKEDFLMQAFSIREVPFFGKFKKNVRPGVKDVPMRPLEDRRKNFR